MGVWRTPPTYPVGIISELDYMTDTTRRAAAYREFRVGIAGGDTDAGFCGQVTRIRPARSEAIAGQPRREAVVIGFGGRGRGPVG